jgi:hypothetical protein
MDRMIGYRLGDNQTPSQIIYPEINKESIKESKNETINNDFYIELNKEPNKEPIVSEINHEFFILDDVVYFLLKGRGTIEGTYAMVSMDKWPQVSKYEWYLGKAGYPLCYKLHKMQLHRFIFTYILGEHPPSDMYVDHIDRNKLNNTDQNLRLATPQENSFNKSTKTNNKGVKKISKNNYSATIVKDGKRHEIKNIKTRKEAAEMYNIMAEELFGEFAAKNTIQ